ncbi:WAVE-DAMPENED 2 protein [Nymphaea thermarum]|nr:WAVE-DAMPENED 2 protein [Nymphaea thermarum]
MGSPPMVMGDRLRLERERERAVKQRKETVNPMTAKKGDRDKKIPSDSISFGRFEVESLSWERRSSFTHNRYLEEVEKYAKPGSVTQKKAYFEAHFKRKALRRLAAADCQNETDDRSSECGDPEQMNCMEDFKDLDDVQHAHFDQTPDMSDEEKFNYSSSHHLELTRKKEEENVSEDLHAKSHPMNTCFDFMLEEKVQSTAAPPQIHHVQVEPDPLLSIEDNRDKGSENVHSFKPQDVAELVEMSGSSKDPSENVETCIMSTKEMKKSSFKGEDSVGRTSSNLKIKQRLAANRNVLGNWSKVASRKPSEEAIPRKAVEKVSKTSMKERKKTELSTVRTRNGVDSVKVVSSNCNSKRQHSGTCDSERRCSTSGISKEKTSPARISTIQKPTPSRNLKAKTTEFTKAKVNQDDRRCNQDKDVRDRKVRDVGQHAALKGVMDVHMSTNRSKFYLRLEEKLHAKEVETNTIQARNQEETEAEIKQFRRSLNFKATPMPAFYLGAAPRPTDFKKGPVTRSQSPSLKKKPTSSSVSSASQDNSGTVDTCTKPFDEKSCDKDCLDIASATIRNETEDGAKGYLLNRKSESSEKDRVKSSHHYQQQHHHHQVQGTAPKGDKAKSRTLRGGTKAINHGVRGRSGMIPLVADVAVAS